MNPRIRALVFSALAVAAGFAAAAPLLRLSGWPMNHDGLAPLQRVEIFRRAMEARDFLPLWTPFAHEGLGSTLPFFYPRLFSTLAAALSFLAGGTLPAVRLLVPLLLAVGFFGMARALTAMGLPTWLGAAGGTLLVFSNYAYTDWLVRGALAELAAFMLVPWFLAAVHALLRGAPRAGIGLGIALTLLFFAHVAIFFFALLTFAVVFAADRLVTPRLPVPLLGPLGVAALVVAVLTGPFLLGLTLFSPAFNVEALQRGHLSVFRNFEEPSRFLLDTSYAWGRTWTGYTLEIGRVFNTAALLGLLAVTVLALVPTTRRAVRAGIVEHREAFVLVLSASAFVALLQLPFAAILYRVLPGARFLSFPWRLLVFATPLSIFLLALCADVLGSLSRVSRLASVGVVLACALYQVFFGLALKVSWQVYGPAEIAFQLTEDGLSAGLYASGEYLPRGVRRPVPAPLLAAENCRAVTSPSGKELRESLEKGEARFDVVSGPGCRVVLNLFESPFLAVEPGPGGRVSLTSGRTYAIAPSSGRRAVAVRRRGLFAALAARLSGKAPPDEAAP